MCMVSRAPLPLSAHSATGRRPQCDADLADPSVEVAACARPLIPPHTPSPSFFASNQDTSALSLNHMPRTPVVGEVGGDGDAEMREEDKAEAETGSDDPTCMYAFRQTFRHARTHAHTHTHTNSRHTRADTHAKTNILTYVVRDIVRDTRAPRRRWCGACELI